LNLSLQNLNGASQPAIKIQQLSGDASTRRYYRVSAENYSAILQQTEPFSQTNEFLLTRDFFAQCGIAVPKVLAIDAEAGLVLQEDLGDDTLLAKLIHGGVAAYEQQGITKALQLLAKIHQSADWTNYKGPAPAGFALAFDHEKLMWEVNFTLEHFFGGYLGREFKGDNKSIVLKEFSKICTQLAAEPRVYTHRDYHTRNIMVDATDRFVSIDFQDARLGLRQYDLASLLRDSYYQMEDAKVYGFIQTYWEECQKLGATKPVHAEMEHFIKMFDWMSIQRNFKALGTFGFQFSVRKNPNYLRYVGNTYENIRRNLAKFPEFNTLSRLLSANYYG